jgi:hypothetical protein
MIFLSSSRQAIFRNVRVEAKKVGNFDDDDTKVLMMMITNYLPNSTETVPKKLTVPQLVKKFPAFY